MFVFGGFVDHNEPNSTRVESSFNFIISFLFINCSMFSSNLTSRVY
jgi:hypothetical protein